METSMRSDESLRRNFLRALSEDERKVFLGPKALQEQKRFSKLWNEINGVADLLREKLSGILFEGPRDTRAGECPGDNETAGRLKEDREKMIQESRVYIVDDEDFIRMLLNRMLTHNGFNNIRSFTDGDEAVSAIFSDDGTFHEIPDLIISDTEMKRMGGPALHEKLEAIPEALRPAVIASSGNFLKKDA